METGNPSVHPYADINGTPKPSHHQYIIIKELKKMRISPLEKILVIFSWIFG
jgi:hypothetical protein